MKCYFLRQMVSDVKSGIGLKYITLERYHSSVCHACEGSTEHCSTPYKILKSTDLAFLR